MLADVLNKLSFLSKRTAENQRKGYGKENSQVVGNALLIAL